MTDKRPDPQNQALPSIAEAIGHTPLVSLDRLVKHFGVKGRILAKLEYLNPGASKKDRTALQMVMDARESGALKEGQPVIERTSGNTGTGLAIVCTALGHPFTAVISKGNSEERVKMMKALGADIRLVDQAPGSTPGQVTAADWKLVEQATEGIAKELGAFRVDQFNMPAIIDVHMKTTGPEVWRQSEGKIDAYCDFVGAAGSFAGLGKFLKSKNKDIACYVIEPAGGEVLAGRESQNPGHKIQGGGYSKTDLAAMKEVAPDGFLAVTSEDAIQCARALAKHEGIFAGFSSGANVWGALQLLKGKHKDQTILVLMCDSGLKYLSTDLWDG